MKITVYIEPVTNKEYRALPTNWNNKVSPLTDTNCQNFGWIIEERTIEDIVPTVKYSKLKLIRSMKDNNIWDNVKAQIEEAQLWDEFVCAQELSSDDERFASIIEDAKKTYGEAAVNAILEASRI